MKTGAIILSLFTNSFYCWISKGLITVPLINPYSRAAYKTLRDRYMVYTFGAVFGEQSDFTFGKTLKNIGSALLCVIIVIAEWQVIITENADITDSRQPPYILELPCKISRKARVTIAVYTDYRAVNKKIAALCFQLNAQRSVLIVSPELPDGFVPREYRNPVLGRLVMIGLNFRQFGSLIAVGKIGVRLFVRLGQNKNIRLYFLTGAHYIGKLTLVL